MPGFLIRRRGGCDPKDKAEALIFPAGTTLFDADHPARCVYLLRSGRVQLSSGHNAIVGYLSPGNFFGEKCLLTPNLPGQIAKSLSLVKVLTYSKAELLRRIRLDRRFSQRLLGNLALRLDRSEVMIHDLITQRAEQRLARLLFRFAPAGATAVWVRLRFSPSNSELAKSIGTTRWRVSHFMHEFQRMGWLERRPHLWIRRESLREFLDQARKE